MICNLKNGEVVKENEINSRDNFIYLCDIDEVLINKNKCFEKIAIEEMLANHMERYEFHQDFDFICVRRNLYEEKKSNVYEMVFVFIEKKAIHFIGDINFLHSFYDEELEQKEVKINEIGRVLHSFLLHITKEYHLILDAVESEIYEFEEQVLASIEEKDYTKRILYYRKQLLQSKRRYEQFEEVLESLLDNNNELYVPLELTRLASLKGRVARMFSQVTSLLEYVTEIREAYQSSIDINQNKTMQFFTVIATIFMPLTLIVGWYGMNLKIPEFGWDLGYPAVITTSVLIVISCVVYFKKKKWF